MAKTTKRTKVIEVWKERATCAIYVTPDQLKRLKALTARTNGEQQFEYVKVPLHSVAREALDLGMDAIERFSDD